MGEQPILTSIYLAGAFFAFFFAAVLFSRDRPGRRSNAYLAAFICVLGIMFLDTRALNSGGYQSVPFLIGLSWPLTALMMPFLFLYARFLIFHSRLHWYEYAHFAIWLLYEVLLWPFYLSPAEEKLAAVYGNLPYGYVLWQVPFVSRIMTVQMIVYTIMGLVLINRYNKALEISLSDVSYIDLGWLKILFLGFFIAVNISPLGGLGPEAFRISQMTMYLMFIGLLVFLAFRALRQKSLDTEADRVCHNTGPSYETSKLDADTARALKEQLEKIVWEQKLWQQDSLKLGELAKLTGIKSHNLSQIFNTCYKQNFYEFINGYRIREYCECMSQGAGLSTTQVSYDVGFNSRTAFYRAFKRVNGTTPSEWQKSLIPGTKPEKNN